MVIKEPTASTFVFRREAGTWLTALVWHLRLDCWLPAGGHVENTENAEEAAIREARGNRPGRPAPARPGRARASRVPAQGLVRPLVDHGNGGLVL
jgi:hypothetical protein